MEKTNKKSGWLRKSIKIGGFVILGLIIIYVVLLVSSRYFPIQTSQVFSGIENIFSSGQNPPEFVGEQQVVFTPSQNTPPSDNAQSDNWNNQPPNNNQVDLCNDIQTPTASVNCVNSVNSVDCYITIAGDSRVIYRFYEYGVWGSLVGDTSAGATTELNSNTQDKVEVVPYDDTSLSECKNKKIIIYRSQFTGEVTQCTKREADFTISVEGFMMDGEPRTTVKICNHEAEDIKVYFRVCSNNNSQISCAEYKIVLDVPPKNYGCYVPSWDTFSVRASESDVVLSDISASEIEVCS